MRRRLVTALGLALIGMPAIILGGIFYFLLMGTFLIGAAWEYVHLFRAVKMEPQIHLTIGGVAFSPHAHVLSEYAMPVYAAAILIALAYHLIAYERAAIDRA